MKDNREFVMYGGRRTAQAFNEAVKREMESQEKLHKKMERALMFKVPKVKPRSKDFLNG